MLFSFSVSLEAKESMKRPDFNFHGVFCFIKYISLSCEKLAVTSKNSGIFGLTNRVASKVSLQLDYIRENFVTLKILCNLSKVHRVQHSMLGDRAEEIRSGGKCRYTQYNWGG